MSEQTPPPSTATSVAAAAAAAATTTTPALTQEGGNKKKEKKKPNNKNFVIPPKQPKLSKAERRAKQEAQRAAKGQQSDKKIPKPSNDDHHNSGSGSGSGGQEGGGYANESGGKVGSDGGTGEGGDMKLNDHTKLGSGDKTLNFFSHLPPYKGQNEFSGVVLGGTPNNNNISQHPPPHPAILSLGLQFKNGSIRGANARAKAMLHTFKKAIMDFTLLPPTTTTTTTNKTKKNKNNNQNDIRSILLHDLLKPSFNYLSNTCRKHSVTMGNAFTFVKTFILESDRDLDLSILKQMCVDAIDTYIYERIVMADKAIVEFAGTKIVNGDVILTYGHSEVIQLLLLDTHTRFQKNKKSHFRVIIVDSRPLLEGREMLDVLTKAGIECTYIFLNSLSYVMKEVTKVFIGAAALMSDGSVLSRVGTAGVALMARPNNIPVLVCCETYKISSRVQLESITSNELGNPDDLISTHCAIDADESCCSNGGGGTNSESLLKEWRSLKSLRLLNLLYDLTPSEFVSGIVTEMGILPSTSVAVLLREMNPDDHQHT